MNEITESFLQAVVGDLEKLLIEDQDNIAFAYRKVGTGLKLSVGITFDPTAEGIAVNYSISYDLEPKPEPPEKHNVKYRHVINDGQAAMEFLGKGIREGRITITAGQAEAALEKLHPGAHYE